jgi:hypothetical protein
LAQASIPKYAFSGKLDFHACRVAYINHVIESGVSVKEAQELARHSTPQLTMNVYGRARVERLAEAVEKVGEALLPNEKYAISMQRKAAGAEGEIITPFVFKGLRMRESGGDEGIRTHHPHPEAGNSSNTETQQKRTNCLHSNALQSSPPCRPEQKPTLPQHSQHTTSHQKYAISMQQHGAAIPSDLKAVINAWADLPEAVKAGIMAMVKAARGVK